MASQNVASLMVDLGLDTSKFTSSMKNVNSDIKNMETGFKNAKKVVDSGSESIDDYSEAIRRGEQTVNAYKNKLDLLSNKYKEQETKLQGLVARQKELPLAISKAEAKLQQMAQTMGRSSAEYQKAEKELEQLKAEFKGMDKTINSTVNSMGTLDSQISQTSNKMEGLQGDINGVKNKLDGLEQESKNAANGLKADASEIGQGWMDVGATVGDVGSKINGVMGGLVKSGAEYSASVESTKFMMNNLDKATQDFINSKSKEAEAIGMTEKQYQEMGVKIASYGENLGLTGDKTNEFSDKVMGLSADFGALIDVPVDEAMRDVKSALMGNFEAVDKYNVSLSAASLENSEYAKSLGKSYSQMTEQEKAQTILAEITRQGASASGLAKQEAQGFSMQMQLLKVKLAETAGEIGQKLLPILEPLIQKFNGVLEKVKEWVAENPKLTAVILGVVGGLGILLTILAPIMTTIGMATIAFGGMGLTMGAIIPIIAGIIGGITLLAGGIQANFEGISLACQNLKASFEQNFAPLAPIFEQTFNTMRSMYETIVKPLFEAVGQIIQIVVDFVAQCMPGISDTFAMVMDYINTLWNNVGKPMWDAVIRVVGIVVDWCRENLPKIADVFNSIMQSLKNAWDTVGKPLFDFIKVIIDKAIQTVLPIIEKLGAIFSKVVNLLKSIWDKIGKPVFDKVVEVCGWLMSKAAPHIEKFGNIVEKIFGAIMKPIDLVIAGFEKVIGWAQKAVDWVGKGINKAGEFLDKINPFKSAPVPDDVNVEQNQNIRTTYGFDMPNIPKLNRASFDATNYTIGQNSGKASRGFKPMNNSFDNSIFDRLEKVLMEGKTINLTNIIELDGRAIAKQSAVYMDAEINAINRRRGRLGGAF